jgi:hexosaminidase
MNVLHLHLTDAEGWRFNVPEYPALTEVSGQTARDGRPGGYFSQDDYAGILEYASARFITLVPEFDSPGHTASVLRAYPQLCSHEMHDAPEAMRFLDPDIPGVWELVGAVYAEMARVHPGARIHIGGDEAIAMDEDSFTRYMETALPAARATGKGIVAWQETARAGFAEGDLMQWWISPHLVEVVRRASEDPENSPFAKTFPDPAVGEAFVKLLLQAPEDLPKALAQGADVIVSRADKLYLDTKYHEPSADPKQEADHQRVGLPQTVYGNGTVQDSFEWDPATLDARLPVDRIAGIEGAIWCETITDERDLMMQLLPRLPGIAEKGWSDPREWAEYHPRLASQRRLWGAMEVNYFVSSVVWPEG